MFYKIQKNIILRKTRTLINHPTLVLEKYLWLIQTKLNMNYQTPLLSDNILEFESRNKLLQHSISKVKVNGLFMEFGVFEGVSINYIASLIPNKKVYGFDSFKGLPEHWRGVYSQGYFELDKMPKVKRNVKLIVGLFQKSLEPFLERHIEKVAFLHLDADLYSSTRYVLFTLAKNNKLQNGTVIQFDEFCGYPRWHVNGEYKAFLEFVKKFKIRFLVLGQSRNKICSIRLRK